MLLFHCNFRYVVMANSHSRESWAQSFKVARVSVYFPVCLFRFWHYRRSVCSCLGTFDLLFQGECGSDCSNFNWFIFFIYIYIYIYTHTHTHTHTHMHAYIHTYIHTGAGHIIRISSKSWFISLIPFKKWNLYNVYIHSTQTDIF